MSDSNDFVLPDDFQKEIQEQARSADVASPHECTDSDRVRCATMYGPRAVECKILVSISENINTMAESIKASEAQKHSERERCLNWFIGIMAVLVTVVVVLIFADTFLGVTVKIEFLASVVVAILADVFAIVHTIVKYMTNVENYEAYSKLIDSLLRHNDGTNS